MTPRELLLLTTGVLLGTRISEALGLTFGSFERETVYIKASKKSKNRFIKIDPVYRYILDNTKVYYEKKGIKVTLNTPIFLGQKSKAKSITRVHALRLFKRLFEKLDMKGSLGTHSLRKKFAADAFIFNKKDPDKTMDMTGHRTMNSLYYYIRSGDVNEAVSTEGFESTKILHRIFEKNLFEKGDETAK